MNGHVFVVRGDLRKLACDAWLMPCGWLQRPEGKWLLPGDPIPEPDPSQAWQDEEERVVRLDGWHPERSQPWLTNVGGSRRQPLEWYLAAVREFVEKVSTSVAGKAGVAGRARPLVALPVVGTAFGGARDRTGDMTRGILDVLYDAALRYEVDYVLVTWDGPTLAAAQGERQRLFEARGLSWPLSDDLLSHGTRLSRYATRGELVLFLGAGVSAGAGLPLWGQLLDALAEVARLDTDERRALSDLDYLDQARVILGRLGGDKGDLARAIAGLMVGRQHSLSHALLAGLPVHEVVTTNYDTLFEDASRGAGRSVAVLPYQAASNRDRWVLKMHGSIEFDPDDIVLSREDYIRYNERRAALAGIVQALLITRHMLFVGFSLNDENFHRIADAVRQALPDDDKDPFGTAAMFSPSPLLQEIWAPDLRWAVLGSDDTPPSDAARTLEIFLDYVLAHSADTAGHLLDDRYLGQLSPPDAEIRAALLAFREALAGLSAPARKTSAYRELLKLLDRFGARQDWKRSRSRRRPR